MARSRRLRFHMEGDLAEAVSWEAERRNVDLQALVTEMLLSSASSLVSLWREQQGPGRIANSRPDPATMRSVQSVLAKAYGPGKVSPRARRRPRS